MAESQPPWWATDPGLAHVLRRSSAEFEQELESRPPATDSNGAQIPDSPDPVVTDLWSGASKRALAAARDDLARSRIRYDEAVLAGREVGLSWGEMARILGVSKQLLHRRFAKGRG